MKVVNTPGCPAMRAVTGLLLLLVIAALTGCTAAIQESDAPGAGSSAGSWSVLAPGLERRDLVHADRAWRMALVRANPAQVQFRMHYRRGDPLTLRGWGAALPEAHAIVNGGFFDELDRALGLVVSDGVAFGNSYVGFGGMLQVDASGVRVRSLVAEPYQGEALQQALQAFPMLIDQGQLIVPEQGGFDTASRRTWIGQDRSGRILVGVVPAFITFADLQSWIAASDLDVWAAFALDGGRSSGMIIRRSGGAEEVIAAFDALPSVLAVYPAPQTGS